MVVCAIAIPQVIIFPIPVLLFAATAIFPLTTPGMINKHRSLRRFPDACNRFSYGKTEELSDRHMIPAMVLIAPGVMVLGELYIAVAL